MIPIVLVLIILKFKKTVSVMSAIVISAAVAYLVTFCSILFTMPTPRRIYVDQGGQRYVSHALSDGDWTYVLLNTLLWGSIWCVCSFIIARIVYRKQFQSTEETIELNLAGRRSLD